MCVHNASITIQASLSTITNGVRITVLLFQRKQKSSEFSIAHHQNTNNIIIAFWERGDTMIMFSCNCYCCCCCSSTLFVMLPSRCAPCCLQINYQRNSLLFSTKEEHMCMIWCDVCVCFIWENDNLFSEYTLDRRWWQQSFEQLKINKTISMNELINQFNQSIYCRNKNTNSFSRQAIFAKSFNIIIHIIKQERPQKMQRSKQASSTNTLQNLVNIIYTACHIQPSSYIYIYINYTCVYCSLSPSPPNVLKISWILI